MIQVMKASENNQRKWKTVSLIFILLTICVVMILVVFSAVHEREAHQVLTCAEVVFDAKKYLQKSVGVGGPVVYDGTFTCVDLDGDEDKEIVSQENIGMSGGAGQYLSRIFDFKDGEIIEIFSFVENEEIFDRGFSLTLLKDKENAIA